MDDFTKTSANPVDSLAQIESLVILLHPSENEGAVRVYPEILIVILRDNVVIVAWLVLAGGASPGHRRRWKPVGVTVEDQPGHALRGVHVLRLLHPPRRNCVISHSQRKSPNSATRSQINRLSRIYSYVHRERPYMYCIYIRIIYSELHIHTLYIYICHRYIHTV